MPNHYTLTKKIRTQNLRRLSKHLIKLLNLKTSYGYKIKTNTLQMTILYNICLSFISSVFLNN